MKNFQYLLLVLFSLVIISCKKENEIIEVKTKPSEKTNSLITEKQIDTLNWYTELCEMNSSFETNKYSKKQLNDTFKLWFASNSYFDFDGYPVFDLDKQLDPIEKLEEDYSNRKKTLENLEIVNLTYWQNIKDLRLKELKSYYEFEKTAYNAYSNTEILAKTNFDKKASIYVEALVSKDSLKMINAWRILNEEQKSKNGSPDDVENKFQSRLNSDRCLEYAKMELFSFGWSNYAVKTNKNCAILNRTDILQTEYLKLFLSTKEECSEP
jgi:hypothetical protein